MKVGDSVISIPQGITSCWSAWERIGLVLGFDGSMVFVFWGEDFPYEEEYRDQLMVV